MSYAIAILDEERIAAYQRFLLGRTDTLFYASLPFKRFLELLLGCESAYFLALDETGRIAGALPSMMMDGGQYGKVTNSLPFYGSNGGIIVAPGKNKKDEGEIRTALFDAFEDYTQAQGCVSSTIITSPFETDQSWYEEHSRADFVDTRIGQITPLPAQGEDVANCLLKMFEDPRPRNIRKAIKSGVESYVSHDRTDIDFLRETHQQNIKAIGGLPKEDLFFSLLEDVFGHDDYDLYIATQGGERIAALLLFYFNRTVEYYVPAIVEDHRTLQPLSLLVFRAMEDAVRRGCTHWNWGGTWMSQTSLYEFKKKWGTEDCVYRYYTRLYSRDLLEQSGSELTKRYPFFFTVPFGELRA